MVPTSEAEIIHEAKMLREHKDRLNSRMKLLEVHNSQLEMQLGKLRQLLNAPGGSCSTSSSENNSAGVSCRDKKTTVKLDWSKIETITQCPIWELQYEFFRKWQFWVKSSIMYPKRQEKDSDAVIDMLLEHKDWLNSRMKLLEVHNSQLEMQLVKLRQLLNAPGRSCSISSSENNSARVNYGDQKTTMKLNALDKVDGKLSEFFRKQQSVVCTGFWYERDRVIENTMSDICEYV